MGTAESNASVYGWRGLEKMSVVSSDLDHPADIHDRHSVRDVTDDREIVGNEQEGQAVLLLQVLQEVDGLRLDADVEGRDRLVRDNQPWLRSKRARDADPLPLAA